MHHFLLQNGWNRKFGVHVEMMSDLSHLAVIKPIEWLDVLEHFLDHRSLVVQTSDSHSIEKHRQEDLGLN